MTGFLKLSLASAIYRALYELFISIEGNPTINTDGAKLKISVVREAED